VTRTTPAIRRWRALLRRRRSVRNRRAPGAHSASPALTPERPAVRRPRSERHAHDQTVYPTAPTEPSLDELPRVRRDGTRALRSDDPRSIRRSAHPLPDMRGSAHGALQAGVHRPAPVRRDPRRTGRDRRSFILPVAQSLRPTDESRDRRRIDTACPVRDLERPAPHPPRSTDERRAKGNRQCPSTPPRPAAGLDA
jgi:hypothetical protein